MYHQMNRFVSRFRDLERKDFTPTGEEERQWKVLKDKLALPQVAEQLETINRKCIAVTSLYVQAGSSFVAGNIAYAWAEKGIPVTLCELPDTNSYYYFALDYERRTNQQVNDASTSLLLMQNNHLRIQIEPPLYHQQKATTTDIANWLLRVSKVSPIVLIDVSSRWTYESKQIFEMADEIWVVFDADLARLTRLFLTEKAPAWWTTEKNKLKFIANKWNSQLSRSSVLKKVEGTLSLWNVEPSPIKVDYTLPLIDGEKTATAHSKGNLLLEFFPDEVSEFQSLIHAYKGRML